jgi:hypothetical protein
MFNNAGVGGALGSIEETSLEHWDKTQAVLLRAVLIGMKHAVPHMKRNGGGSIISHRWRGCGEAQVHLRTPCRASFDNPPQAGTGIAVQIYIFAQPPSRNEKERLIACCFPGARFRTRASQ